MLDRERQKGMISVERDKIGQQIHLIQSPHQNRGGYGTFFVCTLLGDPLPVALWLTFPDLGILTSEQLGAARAFILDRVKPGYFHEKEM